MNGNEKAGDEFGIMYATKIPSRGFQKFSIAHEIGHYCIETSALGQLFKAALGRALHAN